MTRLLLILLMHMLGDFFFQGDNMIWLKYFRLKSLLGHSFIYFICLLLFSPLLLQIPFWYCLIFAVVNGVCHLGVDYYTGILRKKYWEKDETMYATIMGIDQVAHIACLVISFLMIVPDGFHYVSPYYELLPY